MIQPQELRIGNNVNTELGIAEVIGIYEDVVDIKGVSVIDNSSENKISISTRIFDGCVEYEKIQPIRLTEEILLKLGFHKVDIEEDITYRLKPNEDVCIVYENDFSAGLFSSEKMYDTELGVLPRHKQTLYLHQLQNLYFTLTGEELIFKTT